MGGRETRTVGIGRLVTFLAVLVFVFSFMSASTLASECVVPANGMNIAESTTFCPGIYNLPNGITIVASDVVLDCNNATLIGDGSAYSYGIYVNIKNNVTIRNCKVMNYSYGIDLYKSSNNNIINNIANSNDDGIYLFFSSNNNIINNIANSNHLHGIRLRDSSNNNNIINNTANSNEYGIYLGYSSNNNIINNTANSNDWCGISLWGSSNNNIIANNLTNNYEYSLFDYGNAGCNYVENNIGGDGKPIRYEHDTTGINIANTDEYSEIIFCRVSNSVIDNVTISNPGTTSDGILIVYSNNNTIKNSNLINDSTGVYLWYSSNNSIINNIANSNSQRGIFLYKSSNNNIINNIANSNDNGIYLFLNSNNNNIINNTVNSNSDDGISLYYSSNNNNLTKNLICGNGLDIDNDDSNFGDENTCDTTYNWNDIGTTGCIYTCLKGDVNGDCEVNIFDLAAVGLAYGSQPGDGNWNSQADLTGDGKVNIFDLATVGLNYGKSC